MEISRKVNIIILDNHQNREMYEVANYVDITGYDKMTMKNYAWENLEERGYP